MEAAYHDFPKTVTADMSLRVDFGVGGVRDVVRTSEMGRFVDRRYVCWPYLFVSFFLHECNPILVK